jgi:hypothetical protein
VGVKNEEKEKKRKRSGREEKIINNGEGGAGRFD